MRMQIDQTRRDDFAARIDHGRGEIRGYVLRHRHHYRVAYADVTHAAQVLARINHIATFDHEIEFLAGF